MQKYFAFELFDTEEEDDLRGTALPVYLAYEADAAMTQLVAERDAALIENSRLAVRVKELEKALQPFAQACKHAQEYADARESAFKSPMDHRDLFMWQAPRSLCVKDFKSAYTTLSKNEVL